MPVISSGGTTHRVVVKNKRTITAVDKGIEHAVSDDRDTLTVVKKEVEVRKASGVGVQGPSGKDGKDGKDGEASIPAVLDGGNF